MQPTSSALLNSLEGSAGQEPSLDPADLFSKAATQPKGSGVIDVASRLG